MNMTNLCLAMYKFRSYKNSMTKREFINRLNTVRLNLLKEDLFLVSVRDYLGENPLLGNNAVSDSRQILIVILRNGLGGHRLYTFKEIAVKLQLSIGRIQGIYYNTLERLIASSYGKKLFDLDVYFNCDKNLNLKDMLYRLFDNAEIINTDMAIQNLSFLGKLIKYKPTGEDRINFIKWLPPFLDKIYLSVNNPKFSGLGLRNAKMFIRYFCLNGEKIITFVDLGKEYNISDSRVRVIINKTFEQIRSVDYKTGILTVIKL